MGGGTSRKKKPYMKAAVFGVIAIALYVALLNNQEFLNGTFSKGGLYAFLPIVTAFIFSFFHGSFTGHFWTVMGIEAAKKTKEVK
jgi:F0F1-type ATP synthase assembly protein I